MAIVAIELSINDKLFKNNPQHTELGRKILQYSIKMIDEMGLERFNFRKLAQVIGTGEASIYRYFENKRMLLIYLVNWYWEWMKLRIEMKVDHVEDARRQLDIALNCVADTAKKNMRIDFIDEDILNRVVINEGSKAYHNKDVDDRNQEGFFMSYKALCATLSEILLRNNPDFPYPRALASNLLEMANHQTFFAQHLPRLTEIEDNGELMEQVADLLKYFARRMLFCEEGVVEESRLISRN